MSTTTAPFSDGPKRILELDDVECLLLRQCVNTVYRQTVESLGPKERIPRDADYERVRAIAQLESKISGEMRWA